VLLAFGRSGSSRATNFPKVSIESSFSAESCFASFDVHVIIFEACNNKETQDTVFLFLHFGLHELVDVGVVSAFELVRLQSVTSSAYRTCTSRTELFNIFSLFVITIIKKYI
jgi:hypothetical protein